MARLKTMHKRKQRKHARRMTAGYKQALAKAVIHGYAIRLGMYLFDRYVREPLEAVIQAKREEKENGDTETIPGGQ